MRTLAALVLASFVLLPGCLEDNPFYYKTYVPDAGKKYDVSGKHDIKWMFEAQPPPQDGPPPPPHDGPPPPPQDFGPMTNGKCAAAKALAWSGGKFSVSGSTSSSPNEYGTSVNCGDYATIMLANQVYYSVPLKGGSVYRFSLKVQYSYARLILFKACGESQINTDCSSKGKTGDVTASISNGSTGQITFRPPNSGTWILAVDGTRNQYKGTFTLTGEEATGAANDRCSQAQTLTLTGGAATVTGNTAGGLNEFGTGINCGSTTYSYPASQLYYKVGMTAGKAYNVDLRPTFYGAMYIFRSANCTVSGINGDCGSSGKTGAFDYYVAPNQSDDITFKPQTSGEYTIAVDSRYASYSGSFTLKVLEYASQSNSTCAKATPLTLVAGKVGVNGDTSGLTNEYGANILCGQSSSSSAFDGPQQYYSLSLTKGQTYRLSITPKFYYGAMYLFGATCGDTAINKDCGSNGATGGFVRTTSNNPSLLLYTPQSTGTHHIAVDSTSSSGAGAYNLAVEEVATPVNGTCAKAQQVTLTPGKTTTVGGDNSAFPNEFGTQVYCGNYTTVFIGNQAYFKMTLTAGQSYNFTVKSNYSYARFYIFDGSCKPADINTDCSSAGKTGEMSLSIGAGSSRTIKFTPTKSGTHHLAVDSTNAAYKGSFTLDIN